MALKQLHKQKKKTNICLFNFVWDAPNACRGMRFR